jgi:Protein of unknown function (DUF2380)
MLRSRSASRVFAATLLLLGVGLAPARAGSPAAPGIGIAIADFTYRDTSGEPADQAAAHRTRLQGFVAALRRDFAADGQYHLVSIACGESCTEDGPTLLRAATDAGAQLLIIGGIHKESTLIEWAKVEVIDVGADRIVFDRLFSFRGDSDEAWNQAEIFASREIRAVLAAH